MATQHQALNAVGCFFEGGQERPVKGPEGYLRARSRYQVLVLVLVSAGRWGGC